MAGRAVWRRWQISFFFFRKKGRGEEERTLMRDTDESNCACNKLESREE